MGKLEQQKLTTLSSNFNKKTNIYYYTQFAIYI